VFSWRSQRPGHKSPASLADRHERAAETSLANGRRRFAPKTMLTVGPPPRGSQRPRPTDDTRRRPAAAAARSDVLYRRGLRNAKQWAAHVKRVQWPSGAAFAVESERWAEMSCCSSCCCCSCSCSCSCSRNIVLCCNRLSAVNSPRTRGAPWLVGGRAPERRPDRQRQVLLYLNTRHDAGRPPSCFSSIWTPPRPACFMAPHGDEISLPDLLGTARLAARLPAAPPARSERISDDDDDEAQLNLLQAKRAN
jgi:hypothetical protein